MPIRVATGKITLFRDGKRVVVRKDEAFDFTAKELADIRNVNPDAVRKPRIEATPEVRDHLESALEKNAEELGTLASGVKEGDDPAGEGDKAATTRRGRGRPARAAQQSGDDDEL